MIHYFKEYFLKVKTFFKSLNVGSIRIAPYWFYPESQELDLALKDIGFVPYSSRPRIFNRIFKYHTPSQFKTVVVNINREEEDIFASFTKGLRKDIRRAERFIIEVRAAKEISEANLFYKHLRDMCKERNLSFPSYAEFKATFENI